MQANPYLYFNGDCEEALKSYEKCLGGKILAMTCYRGSPAEKMAPPEWADKILHASLKIGDTTILASDAPPGHYSKPAGIGVCLQIGTTGEAEHIFSELSAGGKVQMDLQETFWAFRFAMFTDRFAIPWMINCQKPMQ